MTPRHQGIACTYRKWGPTLAQPRSLQTPVEGWDCQVLAEAAGAQKVEAVVHQAALLAEGAQEKGEAW